MMSDASRYGSGIARDIEQQLLAHLEPLWLPHDSGMPLITY